MRHIHLPSSNTFTFASLWNHQQSQLKKLDNQQKLPLNPTFKSAGESGQISMLRTKLQQKFLSLDEQKQIVEIFQLLSSDDYKTGLGHIQNNANLFTDPQVQEDLLQEIERAKYSNDKLEAKEIATSFRMFFRSSSVKSTQPLNFRQKLKVFDQSSTKNQSNNKEDFFTPRVPEPIPIPPSIYSMEELLNDMFVISDNPTEHSYVQNKIARTLLLLDPEENEVGLSVVKNNLHIFTDSDAQVIVYRAILDGVFNTPPEESDTIAQEFRVLHGLVKA